MKQVSVICASPPHFNPGMHSVDYAFWNYIKRHSFNSAAEFNFYCLLDIPKEIYNFIEFPFTYKLSDQNINAINDSDMVIFWGDFLHSKSYLENELCPQAKKQHAYKNEEFLMDLIYKNLFLENISYRRKTIIIFGGNLLDFRANYYNDERYISRLKDLYSASSLILMRDPISAMTVNNLLNDYEQNFCGVDGAFLSTSNKTRHLYKSKVDTITVTRKVGIFFGRSWYYDEVLSFSCKMCERLRATGVWIPWFHAKPWPLVEKYGDRIDLTAPDADYVGTLDQLTECSLVITDTYHLCINAWSAGIPAICIGRGVGSMKYSVDDKKKEILYSMFDARDFYVYAEDVLRFFEKTDLVVSTSNLDNDMDLMIEILACNTAMEEIFGRIDNHVLSVEKRVTRVLGDHLL